MELSGRYWQDFVNLGIMELIERENFLSILQTQFYNIQEGEGQCVFVSGEAGIGKTSLVRKFSKLIRKILENSRQNTVSVSNELELLQLYIQLEQLRFSNKFDYHITVDEKIDIENTEIPPLLIQPYIENAIQHGLINKNDKGDLWLSLERNNGLLICKIEDNGIGREKAQQIEQKKISRHVALGIKVTNERISTLSDLLDYKIDVVIEDLYKTQQPAEEALQATGTRVTISIPVKEET